MTPDLQENNHTAKETQNQHEVIMEDNKAFEEVAVAGGHIMLRGEEKKLKQKQKNKSKKQKYSDSEQGYQSENGYDINNIKNHSHNKNFNTIAEDHVVAAAPYDNFVPQPIQHSQMVGIESALTRAEDSLHYMVNGIQSAISARQEGLETNAIWSSYWRFLYNMAAQLHRISQDVTSLHYGDYYFEPRIVQSHPYSNIVMPSEQNEVGL